MRSDFDGSSGFFPSEEGTNRNMSMLYGLSDFWHIMFEDSDQINMLMEANAICASDVYSQFLQLTSSLSLENVQLNLGSQLKLLILSSSDKVPGSVATFRLPEGFQACRYLINRPFLATVTYESGVHYFVDIEANTVQFSEDPFSSKFPTRASQSGGIEIAIWAVDTLLDERWMYQYYGSLIGVSPQDSTEKYRNFLYGLFYLYIHGPDLAMVRKGLNVALGVPLARDNETVLSVRKYQGSSQYIVITDLNSYLLPYGLIPTVAEGDTLKVGSEITTWVEVKDYVNDGDWWINLEIPKTILPYVPDGQIDSYAKPGSYADYLMRNYLRHHTFLVKVNVTTFKNIESFQQLGDIISKVKPAYTTPIYIWAVPIDDEVIRFVEEIASTRMDSTRSEFIFAQIRRLRRNSNDPIARGDRAFCRMDLGHSDCSLLGLDSYVNGVPTEVDGGTAQGIVNRMRPMRGNTSYETALLRTKFRRKERNSVHSRNMVVHARGVDPSLPSGIPEDPYLDLVPAGMFSVPLYMTTLEDLTDRFSSIGIQVPQSSSVFTLLKPEISLGGVNDVEVNGVLTYSKFDLFVSEYEAIFHKGAKGSYLGVFTPDSLRDYEFSPVVSYLKETDYILCTQVYEKVYGVYLVTSSTAMTALYARSVREIKDPDVLEVSNPEMPFTRGLGLPTGTPVYSFRGGHLNISGGDLSVSGVNEQALNENPFPTQDLSVLYSDTLNFGIPKTRGSIKIQVISELGADLNPQAE